MLPFFGLEYRWLSLPYFLLLFNTGRSRSKNISGILVQLLDQGCLQEELDAGFFLLKETSINHNLTHYLMIAGRTIKTEA
jgi:hypothetical protein